MIYLIALVVIYLFAGFIVWVLADDSIQDIRPWWKSWLFIIFWFPIAIYATIWTMVKR